MSVIDDIEHKADLEKIIMVGDRVLIRPQKTGNKTKSGLYLPPGVKEKESVQTGYVIKVGPGYPIPNIAEADEPWKTTEDVKYIPIQPKEGDLAVFLQGNAFEIKVNNEKHFIVPNASILMSHTGNGRKSLAFRRRL